MSQNIDEYQEETDQVSQPQDDNDVDRQPEISQTEETTNEWTREREKNLEEKLAADGDISDEEMEGYDEWVQAGKPNPEPDGESSEEKNLEATESNADSVETNDESSSPRSEEEIQSLTDAMKAVGAKTVDELPAKIAGLRSKLGQQGGEMGSQLKTSQEQLTNMTSLLEGIAKGEPQAIEYMRNVYPDFKAPTAEAQAKAPKVEGVDPDQFLDPDMYNYVRNLEDKYATMEASIEKMQGYQNQSTEQAAQFAAVEQSVTEVTSFTNKHPEYFDAAADVSGLTREYYRQDNDHPVDPRMTKVHHLLQFANDNNLKTLDDAHFLMNRDNFSKQLIEAEQRGRNSNYQHKQNPSAAGKRQQSSESTYKQYSDSEVLDIAEGRKEIPDSWTHADGSWNFDSVPATARKYIGESPR